MDFLCGCTLHDIVCPSSTLTHLTMYAYPFQSAYTPLFHSAIRIPWNVSPAVPGRPWRLICCVAKVYSDNHSRPQSVTFAQAVVSSILIRDVIQASFRTAIHQYPSSRVAFKIPTQCQPLRFIRLAIPCPTSLRCLDFLVSFVPVSLLLLFPRIPSPPNN